ncbi:Single myb histone 5 [Linum perenne]
MAADEDVSRWALQFLIQQPIPGNLLERVVSNLKPSVLDFHLKKQLNLKLIQSEISNGSVSEKILEALEVIDQLDRDNGETPISQAMKTAYWAVALECTVKRRIQLDVVDRIWRGRVKNLESLNKSELVTDELRKYRDEVVGAASDVNASKRLLQWTKRNNAAHLVRAYLDEAMTANNHPSFIELAAARWKKMEVEKKKKKAQCGHEEMGEGSVREVDPRQDLGAEDGMDNGFERVPDHVEQPIAGSPDTDTRNKNKGYDRVKHFTSHKRQKRQARVGDNPPSKYDTLSSPEVKQAQEALRSCAIELQAAVNDPLPAAMRASESLIAEAPRNVSNTEKSVENQNEGNFPDLRTDTLDPDIPAEKGNRKEVDEPEPSAQQDHGAMQTDESNKADGLSEHQHVPKPSLMTRNSTACTYEWNDSISSSSEATSDGRRRIQIKSPKRGVVRPLTRIDAFNGPRRRKRRWSAEEEAALREGVAEFGKGKWKIILESRRDLFDDRTEVDLKDKWRNMTPCV